MTMLIFKALLYILVGILVLVIVLHTLIRIIRYFYKFPMPQFLANVIDNPLRRKIQPPDETAIRHGIKPDMTVLEVGPGNGTYTVAAAKRVGSKGTVYAIDIEPKMINRVRKRVKEEHIKNIKAQVANVYNLPYDDGMFDLVYMITVISEIPKPEKALKEFHRVLSSKGTLVFSELFNDPDYPLSRTLIKLATSNGFKLKEKKGNFFYYTLIFKKQ